MTSNLEAFVGMMIILMFICLYFLPGLVATSRRHSQTMAIWVLTFVGGWTLLGWIVALVWACTNTDGRRNSARDDFLPPTRR